MLRQNWSYRKGIETRKKQSENRTKVCNLTKTSKS